MAKKGIYWLYAYLIAGIADMLLIAQQIENWRYLTKPLILITLISYFYFNSSPIQNTTLRKSILAALLFSLMGDILLLFPNLFLYGLGAFFMAHICYIIAFKICQAQTNILKGVNFIKLFFYNLVFYIPAAFVYFLIRNNLQQMKIPVILYIIVILTMVTTARERFKRTNTSSFWQVMVGASLFYISDGILALNLFFQPIQDGGIMIMGTYILAQLLIVMGLRSHWLPTQVVYQKMQEEGKPKT
ncbi:lysoplasmalogenase [Pararhodonellum marinum]|uniref:lysoplasmalogenase n=1 Tax=Pararhodonellum marinum TaxID=2755358 RepID=UPI00188F3BC5|nr:lysoplasmalogenase [Pararhodonellum marinum]